MFSAEVISESGYELMVLLVTIGLALLSTFRKLWKNEKLNVSDKISFYGLCILLLISIGMILSKNKDVLYEKKRLNDNLTSLMEKQADESKEGQNHFDLQLKQAKESEQNLLNELSRLRKTIEKSGLEYDPTTDTYIRRWSLTDKDKLRFNEQFEYCNEFQIILISNSENSKYFADQIKKYLISKRKKVLGIHYMIYNSYEGVPDNYFFEPNCTIVVSERKQ